jgi:plastocyanin
MRHQRSLSRLVAAAGFAGLLLVGLPSGAQAATPKKVSIVSSSISCKSAFCYQPSKLKVLSTGSVTWTNKTGVIHTVSRCTTAACGVSGGTGTDTGFDSPTISPAGTYSFTFHGKGTYVYYCQIHGFAVMHGTITVA